MAVLPIITAPDPRLKAVSADVDKVDADVRGFLDDLLETMYAAPGIGLAAIQVGRAERMIVIDASEDKDVGRAPLFLVNPEIAWLSDDAVCREEGCLSLPEQFAEVVRPAAIRVRYLDYQGAACDLEVDGLLAACIQHEMDHLEGVLFVDHISALKRNIILRRLIKARKQKAPADA